jgi:hypothetical protein
MALKYDVMRDRVPHRKGDQKMVDGFEQEC